MSQPNLPLQIPEACGRCGSKDVGADFVSRAFVEGERIAVVEGIPAVVCRACGAQHYDDMSAIVINALRGDGFPAASAVDFVSVPVFRFGDHAAKSAD